MIYVTFIVFTFILWTITSDTGVKDFLPKMWEHVTTHQSNCMALESITGIFHLQTNTEEQGSIFFLQWSNHFHFSSPLGIVEFQPLFRIIVASILAFSKQKIPSGKITPSLVFFFKQGRLQSTTFSDKSVINMMYVLRPPYFEFSNL